MKLLLDQGLPRTAAGLLSAAGIDTVHTSEIGLATATDPGILALARQDGRVVVTLDADFHNELALTRASAPSTVRIRIEGLTGEALAKLLLSVLQQCDEDLEQGSAVTVQTGRIRIRRLPLIR